MALAKGSQLAVHTHTLIMKWFKTDSYHMYSASSKSRRRTQQFNGNAACQTYLGQKDTPQ